MNASVKTLVYSAIVSVLFLGFSLSGLSAAVAPCDGFGCAGVGLQFAFVYFVVVSVVFGIFGYRWAREKKFRQAFVSFGISFAVALVVLIPRVIMVRNEESARVQKEFQDMKARSEANPEQYKTRPY